MYIPRNNDLTLTSLRTVKAGSENNFHLNDGTFYLNLFLSA